MAGGLAVALAALARPHATLSSGDHPLVLWPSRDVSVAVDDLSASVPRVASVDAETAPQLWVSNDDEDPRDSIALLEFTLPPLPEDHVVGLAELRLYAEDITLPRNQPSRTLWVMGNGSSWDPTTMSGEPVSPACCASARWREDLREPGWASWDVTALVVAWYEGTTNHGLRVTPSQHLTGDHYYFSFASAEGEHRPELVLTLKPRVRRLWLPALPAGGA